MIHKCVLHSNTQYTNYTENFFINTVFVLHMSKHVINKQTAANERFQNIQYTVS